MELSILIAYRDRPKSLLTQLTQIKRNLIFYKDNVEVIVVDLGSKKKLHNETATFPFVSYMYIPYSGTFCKSWALNVAFRKSRFPWILVLDVDCIFFEKLLSGLKQLADPNDKGTFYLFKGIRDLPEQLTALIHQKQILTSQLKSIMEANFNHMDNLGGVGNILVHRNVYEKLTGYDEHMFGWGREDSDFYNRVKTAGIKEIQIPAEPGLSLFHLYHHRGAITYNNLLTFYNNDFVESYNKKKCILSPNLSDGWGNSDLAPNQYKYEELSTFEVEKTAKGEAVLKVNGVYFNSPENPFNIDEELEGFEDLESINTPGIPIVILGGGLNYAYKVLSQQAKQVFIIEKYKTIKDLAIEHNQIPAQVFMDTDIKSMFDFLARMEQLKPKVVLIHKPSFEMDKDWYQAVSNVIQSISAASQPIV